MELEINIPEINRMINVYGAIVATPGITDEIKKKCNENISHLLNLLDPVVDQLRKENSIFANLSL